MSPTTVVLITLAATLIRAIDKAFTDETLGPVLSKPVRLIFACVGGIVVGALDATVGGAAFLVSLLSGFCATAPTLIGLLLPLIMPAAQVVKTIVAVAFLAALSLSQTACQAATAACQVIHLADYACTTLVMADGSEIALTKADTDTPDHLAAAMGRRGVKGCR